MTIGFARDGHVLDLALERFVLEDLADDERHELKAHLRDCELCRGRADQIRLDLSVPMPPLDVTRAMIPTQTPPPRPSPMLAGITVGTTLGLIAVAVWMAVRSC